MTRAVASRKQGDPIEAYDPARDAWTPLSPLPEARHHITLSAVKGWLYGAGGFTGGFPNWRAQPTVFVYNPSSNRWTTGVDLEVARAEGVAAVITARSMSSAAASF